MVIYIISDISMIFLFIAILTTTQTECMGIFAVGTDDPWLNVPVIIPSLSVNSLLRECIIFISKCIIF